MTGEIAQSSLEQRIDVGGSRQMDVSLSWVSMREEMSCRLTQEARTRGSTHWAISKVNMRALTGLAITAVTGDAKL